MRLSRDTETALGVVITTVVAFVAVAPCPLARVPMLIVLACVCSLAGAFVLRSVPLAIGVALAYVAFAMQTRMCKRERFSVNAVDDTVPQEAASPCPFTLLEPDIAKVSETMTREKLQALITPEHLEAAQSNLVG